jgi:hypothetical protein
MVLPLPSAARRRRRGGITLEAIVVLLILLISTLAVFQFGFAMVVRQATAQAATVAAREAAKGADVAELSDIIDAVFQAHDIRVGDGAGFILEDGLLPPIMQGDVTCTLPDSPAVGADEVRVTVCVAMDRRPFINPLATVGASFTGKTFQATSLVKFE